MLFGALPRALRFERSGLGIFTGRFAPEDPRLGKPLPVSLRPFRQGRPVSVEMLVGHALWRIGRQYCRIRQLPAVGITEA